MQATENRQAAWDKVVKQAQDTLKFVVEIIQDFSHETSNVVNEDAFSNLTKYMGLKAAILQDFPKIAPEKDDVWLTKFNQSFTTYTNALDTAAKAIADFNKK